jgi:hypothetical protein
MFGNQARIFPGGLPFLAIRRANTTAASIPISPNKPSKA